MTADYQTPMNGYRRAPKAGFVVEMFNHPAGPTTLTRTLECFYCGGQVTYAKATFDHIFPRSQANPDLADCADNLVVACSPCNTSKGTRTWDQWFAVLIDRVRPNPPYDIAADADPREVAVTERHDIISALIAYRQLDHLHNGTISIEHLTADIVHHKQRNQ